MKKYNLTMSQFENLKMKNNKTRITQLKQISADIKSYLIIITCIICVPFSFAQSNSTSLSLEDAIQRSLVNRYDLKIQKVNTLIAENEVSKVNTRSLPQLTSDLDFRYNSQLQTNIIPGGFFGSPNAPDKEVQFGTKYNTLWGFNLNQTSFNPTNISDRKIAAVQTEYQRQNEKLTEIVIKEEVTEAYFTALLWKEKIALSSENVKRAEEVYQVTKNQLSMAQATSYDVQRYKIDLENAKAADEQNARSYELSRTDLVYKISDDSIKNPVLTDKITDLVKAFSLIPTGNQEIKRTELDQEKIQLQIYELNIKKQNLSYLPTLSVYGNYSLQYLNKDLALFTSTNWYPFNYLGVKASIPLFDGGLKAKTRQEYKLRSELSQFNYNKLSRDFRQEVLSAQTSLNNALSDLNYQKKNLELIEDLYKIDTERLRNGAIKQSDLTSTYYTLQQTQTNYLNSVYNYLVSVVRYKKAAGLL
jgi:outer membrane protein TolC